MNECDRIGFYRHEAHGTHSNHWIIMPVKCVALEDTLANRLQSKTILKREFFNLPTESTRSLSRSLRLSWCPAVRTTPLLYRKPCAPTALRTEDFKNIKFTLTLIAYLPRKPFYKQMKSIFWVEISSIPSENTLYRAQCCCTTDAATDAAVDFNTRQNANNS